MDLYHHDGQGNIFDMDGDGTLTVADTIEESRKRDREDDNEDTGGTGGQAPHDGGSQPNTQPSDPTLAPPNPTPSDPPASGIVATLEDIVFLFNPMVEQLMEDAVSNNNGDDFRALQAFHESSQQAWNTIPANITASGSNIYQWESAIEMLNAAGHAVQFVAGAVRRDLVFDGYHDQTGNRIWTHTRYDDSYTYPSLGSKTEIIVHHATIVNLKNTLRQRIMDGDLITSSYEQKLAYYVTLRQYLLNTRYAVYNTAHMEQ